MTIQEAAISSELTSQWVHVNDYNSVLANPKGTWFVQYRVGFNQEYPWFVTNSVLGICNSFETRDQAMHYVESRAQLELKVL